MTLRTFSGVPRAYNRVNITLPDIDAANTAETGILASTILSGGVGGPVSEESFVLAQPSLPVSPAVAFPAGLSFSHAYYKASDAKIYFRFANETGSNYTDAAVITVDVLVF